MKQARHVIPVAGVLLLLTMPARRSAQATAPSTTSRPDPSKADPPKERRIDPRATDTLKKMSAFLAATKRFTMEAEESFDEVKGGAPRVQLSNVRRVAVERPSRFGADATGDTLNRSAWYDGRTLSVLNKAKNLYVTVEMPATIDGVLDKVAEDYGIVIPLSDFAYANPYETLIEGVLQGEYVGIHQTGGASCHHLAFSQGDLDWQIWIDAGAQPIPRKLVITYVDEAGAPQYVANIRRFTVDPQAPADLFKFTPPAGAQKIDAAKFLTAKTGEKP
jgi:hypothetical protein